MATGAPGTNGVWQYGEDDSEATFSALLNKVASTADSSIGTDRGRLTTLEGRELAGAVLIKSQTVGTGVSSVTVTSAFSTTYNSYRIIYSGGAGSANVTITLKLGTTVTGYYGGMMHCTYANTSATAANSNSANWSYVGSIDTVGGGCDLDLHAPFLTTRTIISARYSNPNPAGSGGVYGGVLANATSYTDFIIAPNSGTITGGTIYVYGMKK